MSSRSATPNHPMGGWAQPWRDEPRSGLGFPGGLVLVPALLVFPHDRAGLEFDLEAKGAYVFPEYLGLGHLGASPRRHAYGPAGLRHRLEPRGHEGQLERVGRALDRGEGDGLVRLRRRVRLDERMKAHHA